MLCKYCKPKTRHLWLQHKTPQKFVGVWEVCHSRLGEKGRKDLCGAEHQLLTSSRKVGDHMFCNYQTYYSVDMLLYVLSKYCERCTCIVWLQVCGGTVQIFVIGSGRGWHLKGRKDLQYKGGVAHTSNCLDSGGSYEYVLQLSNIQVCRYVTLCFEQILWAGAHV